eukprot:TRINITY_DN65471_c0_g1_i1.p1 TRINITY_DN65471_c0_g1~~TRINITY_DN65471_c0_g1_i1.p1  ORF type:complete len:292 (-),score=35.67 TRINITY_DN65471_c0_g1_i1:93-968(-)
MLRQASQSMRLTLRSASCASFGPFRTNRSCSGNASPPLVLVLDLDETLVRPVVHGNHKNRTLSKVDKTVTIPVGNGVRCDLSFRPGLDDFFTWIKERRTAGALEGPWLFAQGQPAYVKAVLPTIDKDGHIFGDRILDHRSCTVLDRSPAYNLKDLSRIPLDGGGEAHLSRMVLVENFALSCVLNPGNALLVTDWKGDDESDGELLRICGALDDLISEVGGSGDSAGDYAGRLVEKTPGHARFRERLEALHERLLAGPPSLSPMKMRKHMQEVFEEACDAKRDLLGLGPGEY